MARIIPLRDLPVYSIADLPDKSISYQDGAVFLINKPKDWSSFEVVKYLRKCINLRKIGHAGTLDPMATGLLILCCGKATRTISEIQNLPKTYTGSIMFGASTYSMDTESDIEKTAPFNHITKAAVEKALEEHFSGTIMQLPPMYSALKHKGKPLYKLARQHKEVEREPRKVTIYSSRILKYDLPAVEISIRCSKGTYIRSVSHELGLKLGSAAHLSALKRTAIGSFRNENALTIDDLNLIFGTSGK